MKKLEAGLDSSEPAFYVNHDLGTYKIEENIILYSAVELA